MIDFAFFFTHVFFDFFHKVFILLPHRIFYISLMLSTPVIMGVIVLMMIVVSGDDTPALRDTISSLCSLNKVGKFASCCGSYDNGASITLESSPARSCFISDLGFTTGSVLTSLFADLFPFLMIAIAFVLVSFFQGFHTKTTFCFREGCFLQSHKSRKPLLPHSFLHSLSLTLLKVSIQQSCFN